jgi:hypothetical protein
MKCGGFIDQLGTGSFSRTLLHGSSKCKKFGGEQKYWTTGNFCSQTFMCEGGTLPGFDCTSDSGDGRPIWVSLTSCSLTPKGIHLMKAPGRHSVNPLRFMALGVSSPHSQISTLMSGLCYYYFFFRPPLVVTFPLFLFSRTVIGLILPAVGEAQQNHGSVSSYTLALIAIVMTPGRQMGHVEILPCCSYQKCVLEARGLLWGRPSSKVVLAASVV